MTKSSAPGKSPGGHAGGGGIGTLALTAFKAEAMLLDDQLEGMYLDVVRKIDSLLNCTEAVEENAPVQVDYL